jgi:hypothetical protein
MTTQQTNLTDLLAAHPRTVAAVDKWASACPLANRTASNAAEVIREYAQKHGYADAYFTSLPDLLATIEARLTAEATPPISDEEIAKMRWRACEIRNFASVVEGKLIDGGNFHAVNQINRDDAITAHNADIDRLASEIRRLRAKCGEATP